MLLDRAIDSLRQSGLETGLQRGPSDHAARGDVRLRLRADQVAHMFVVEERRRAPYVGELRLLPDRETFRDVSRLLIAPYISASLGEALIAAGWSWADTQGNFDIRAPGLRWHQRLTTGPTRARRTGMPRGRAATAIIRRLLTRVDTGAPINRSELATIAGVSQPRVSQILGRLVELDFVVREGRQLRLSAPEPLLDQLIAGGALLRGETRFAATGVPLLAVARQAATDGEGVAVSADVGLDGLASYRQPTHLVLYGTTPPRWKELGVEETPSAQANLIWRVPEERSLFATTQRGLGRNNGLRVVDTPQLIAELHSLGGDDRTEAATMLRSWFLRARNHSIPRGPRQR